ncbi:MAG: carboxypeptidase-like regulatory domain-containing protein [Myxococcota bacterium]|nr:carboxypeptidase-like regulatory domain-containing protein [Myxococcota bacterium]
MSLLMLSLLGCMSMENSLAESDAGGAEFEPRDYLVRLDVWPSSSDESLPQSFFDVSFDSDSAWSTTLQLGVPVTVSGQLTGFQANPTAISVPGQDGAVEGFFQALVPGTPMGRVVQTDERGAFSAQVVPSEGYTVALIPSTPSLLPFLVTGGEDLFTDQDFSTYLDFGLPVWGSVTLPASEDTGGLSGLDQGVVRLTHSASGISGPERPVEDGFYMLRAYPGDYLLELYDPDDPDFPLIQRAITVGAEDASGLQEDFELPEIAQVVAQGEVRDADSRPYSGVEVRFTSLSLEGLPEGSHTVETTTNGSGLYIARLLPGSYLVEYLPPYGDDASSAEVVDVQVSGTSTLPTQTLEPLTLVEATVSTENGLAPGTLVRAQEVGFDQRVYETTSGPDGSFLLPVSDGQLEWTFTPDLGTQAATTFKAMTAQEMIEAEQVLLDAGVQLSGVVLLEGEPVPYSVVDVRDAEDKLWAQTVTDDEGWFQVRVSEAIALEE